MEKSIFYSWQSDLPNKTNRSFIEDAIKKAIRKLSSAESISVFMDYDRDTLGVRGSPDIANTIFDKIKKSSLFICDISIVNNNIFTKKSRKTPNPNVLLELGFAINALGWDNIICIMNEDFGDISLIPFDLRQHRIITYSTKDSSSKEKLINILHKNICELYSAGKLFNPINDYMAGKIDKEFLEIGKKLSNIAFGTITMTDGLSKIQDLLNLTKEDIINLIREKKIPLFFILNNYTNTQTELLKILDSIFSSNYFSKEWANVVLRLINWLREYKKLISSRFNPNLLNILDENINKQYQIISGKDLNEENPKDSRIIMKRINNGNRKLGIVVNTSEYPDSPSDLNKLCVINQEYIEKVSNLFYEFITLFNEWKKSGEYEIILDPDIYIIK